MNEFKKNKNKILDKMHECFYEKEYLETIITITEKKLIIFQYLQLYTNIHIRTYHMQYIFFMQNTFSICCC